MRTMHRVVLGGIVLCAFSGLGTGCSLSPDQPQAPVITKTVTASPSETVASPSPSQEREEETAQAPFQAVMTIAETNIDGTSVTVAGFATGIIEDGGTCTFTLTPTSGGAPVTRETVGLANVADTSCGSTDVPITELSRGSWTVTLTYSSEEGAVMSLPLQVEVP